MATKRANIMMASGLILLHIIVLGLAVYSWASIYNFILPHSAYDLFPVLGLLAFGFMWIHYVASATNRFFNNAFDLKQYYRWTGYVVLLLIILHPGILIYSLFRDGYGLPPKSYINYVGKAGELAVLMGSVAFLIFILYELKPKLQKTKFWPVMLGLNDVAMFLIFLHARRLGDSLHLTWYRNLWTFYGLVLLLCIAQRLYFIYKHRSPSSQRRLGSSNK